MGADRETGLEVREPARVDQLLLHFAERAAVETQLDEAWTYSRSVDPVCPLIDPTLAQRLGGYCVNVRRQVFVIICGVVARHRENMESARFRQAAQQHRITAQTGCCGIDEGSAAERA